VAGVGSFPHGTRWAALALLFLARAGTRLSRISLRGVPKEDDVRLCPSAHPTRRSAMWWGIGIGVFFYVVLPFTLGFMTIRNGHGWMFFFGIFFPLLWLIGAFMRPTRQEYA
jgi:hypothetical protein